MRSRPVEVLEAVLLEHMLQVRLAHVEPDVVKVDMFLVRGIDRFATKQRIVKSLVGLCDDLEVKTVAEGVETKAEQDCCAELGCTWLQGYRFAKLGEAFPVVDWGAL